MTLKDLISNIPNNKYINKGQGRVVLAKGERTIEAEVNSVNGFYTRVLNVRITNEGTYKHSYRLRTVFVSESELCLDSFLNHILNYSENIDINYDISALLASENLFINNKLFHGAMIDYDFVTHLAYCCDDR